MLRHALFAAAFALAACSSPTTQNAYQQSQVPVTPKGSIVCLVHDASTHLPLTGVTVTVVGGSGGTLTTDATGAAVFTDAVVNSSYTLVFDMTGFVRQTVSSNWVNGSTGLSPLAGAYATMDVELYKANAQLKGAVFLPDGTAASGVTVSIDQNYDGAGESLLTTQTAADGTFTLNGLASYPDGLGHQVVVYPPDLNADGLPDFETIYEYINSYPGETARAFFDFSQSTNTQQRVVASNLLQGSIAPGADLKVTFSNPVLPTNLDGQANDAFVLTDQVSGLPVGTAVTWASSTQVSIKPVGGLPPGGRYALSISVTSAHTQAGTDPNFFQTLSFQVRPDGVTPISTQVTNLVVENPAYASSQQRAQFDWNTNQFQVSWNGVAGANRYLVYVKDTKRNLDWAQVQTVSGSNVSRLVTTVFLPAAFDLFPDQVGIQPLAQGNSLTFTVVPVDVYGYMAPLASSPTVNVADNVQPTVVATLVPITTSPLFGLNLVDAINDDAVPAQWLFKARYSEPMDSASPPVFAGNGNPTQLWQGAWDPGTASFLYTLTLNIQAGTDASGNFLIRGGKDVAGNEVINGDFQSSLSGFKTLSQNPTFEDATGTCQLTGWNPTTSGTMPAPAAVLGTGDLGGTGLGSRCAAVLGVTANGTAATGISRISQDLTLPSLTGTNWSFLIHADLRGTFLGPAPIAQQICQLTDTSDVSLGVSLGGAGVFGPSSTNAAYAGATTSVRMTCKVDNSLGTSVANNTALYVDNFAIYLYKPGAM